MSKIKKISAEIIKKNTNPIEKLVKMSHFDFKAQNVTF